MIIGKDLLILCPSLRQKTEKHMTKSYRSQVMPAVISYSYWYAFSYILFLVIEPLCHSANGFLHIINLFINKNLYYGNKF